MAIGATSSLSRRLVVWRWARALPATTRWLSFLSSQAKMYRESGANERRRYRPVQACSAREARRSLIRVRPEVRSSLRRVRLVWGDDAPARKRLAWVMLAGRRIGNDMLVGARGPRWFGTRRRAWTSPLIGRPQTLAIASRLQPRLGWGVGPTIMVSRTSAWRLLAYRSLGAATHRDNDETIA